MIRKKPAHWPTLNTVMMVEQALREMPGSAMKVAELKRALPTQVNHQTLITILDYLDKSGKIAIGVHGITWVYTDSRTLRALIAKGTEV